MPKPDCCALPSLQWGRFVSSRRILSSSQTPKAIENAEKWGWSHRSGITCLRAGLLGSSLSLCCLGAAWPSPGAASSRSAEPFQQTTGNGHFPVKEHSSCRSATNYFLCFGEMRRLFSPVTVQPQQSYGKTPRNRRIQYITAPWVRSWPVKLSTHSAGYDAHEFSLQLFLSLEYWINSSPQIVHQLGDFAVHGELPELSGFQSWPQLFY